MAHSGLAAREPRVSSFRLAVFRALTVALVCLICFAVLEAAIRIALRRALTAETYAPLIPSRVPGLGYQLAPNHSDPLIQTDARGMRQRPADPVPVRHTVLLLGDSLTFGSGVPYEKSFALGLESRLNEGLHERTAVWNGAVPGYNTSQESAMLDLLGQSVQPNVVIVAFCMNDYLDPPRLTPGGTLDATTTDGPSKVSLTGILYRSRVFVFTKEKLKDLEKARPEWFPVWAHYIHRITQKPGWPRAEDALLRMSESAKKLNAQLLVVIFPVEQQLRIPDRVAQDDLLRFGRQHGIRMLDLYEPFRAHWREGLFIDYWPQAKSVDKLHMSERGHALAAREISSELLQRRDLYFGAPQAEQIPEPAAREAEAR